MRLVALSVTLLFGSQAAFACAMPSKHHLPNIAALMDEVDAAAPVVAQADPAPEQNDAARIEPTPARVETAPTTIPELAAPPAKAEPLPTRTPAKTRS